MLEYLKSAEEGWLLICLVLASGLIGAPRSGRLSCYSTTTDDD